MGDRFENTAIIETPDLDDYIRLVTKEGGTRRALASELAKKIVEEYEGSELGGEERTIQAAIADAKQVASEAIQEEQTAREEADTALTADLAKKAYADGEYADLHAGTANQLLASTYTTDEEPYHYRQTPSHAGTREMDEIVGGSVVWNQLVNTSTSSVTVTSGHKYVAKISDAWSVGVSTGTALSVTGGTDMVFDITQMFPTAIADHIYNLEQATEGAGVAFFRKYFPEEYYAYDVGTMRSVEGLASHDTVGFNQWDEEWEVGAYSSGNGSKYDASPNRIRNKNKIPVFPNTTYYISGGVNASNPNTMYFYDEDEAYLGVSYQTARYNAEFTTPDKAHYMCFNTGTGYGATYKNDICINISDTTKNGQYEPYEKHSYPLDSTVTLRGIPQLVDGQLKFDGDTYSADGVVTRRYGIVDLGTLNWERRAGTINTSVFGFAGQSVSPTSINTGGNVTNNILYSGGNYTVTYVNNIYRGTADNLTIAVNRGAVYIRDDSYTDSASFKSAMSGQYLIYELATPTTEQAEPYQSLQICSLYGTEEYVSTSIVPIGHYTKYPTDLKSIVEQIADAPSADGTYTLKATVSNGVVTYSWESA